MASSKAASHDNALNREAVERVLGPVDGALAAQLIAIGATEQELREANAWSVDNDTPVNEFRPFPSGRVAELIEILETPRDVEPDEV